MAHFNPLTSYKEHGREGARISRPMLMLSVLALLMVMVPGLGHTVNGSTRWIRLGFVNFQVVEAVKLMSVSDKRESTDGFKLWV